MSIVERHAAIIALLKEPTIEKAAQQLGVAESTLYRWLNDESFKAEYKAAQRQALGRASARLKVNAVKAVETLEDVMTSPKPQAMARVAAARAFLEFALKLHELDDLQERIEALEAAQGKQDGGKWLRVGESDESRPNEPYGAVDGT